VTDFCRRSSLGRLRSIIDGDGILRQPHASYLNIAEVIGCKNSTLAHYQQTLQPQYGKHLRHDEAKAARPASKRDPLARLAVRNIEVERTNTSLANRNQVVMEKFVRGGYGQFPRAFIDRIVDSTVTETQRRALTLGLRERVHQDPNTYQRYMYQFSNDYRIPSAGSSADVSPSIDPRTGQSRGRPSSNTRDRTPGVSPYNLADAVSDRLRVSDERRRSPSTSHRPRSSGEPSGSRRRR
jgi:hypothetical protein